VAEFKTQIGIVGAGPAGLMLAHLLHQRGIHSIILEARTRQYCEERIRAGVLEQGSVDMLRTADVASRLDKEGMRHEGIEIGANHRRHRVPLAELTRGKAVTVYGQHEVVKDLIARRIADGGDIRFECDDVTLHGIEGDRPSLRCLHNGEEVQIHCNFIAGCDGFHGISRPTIPTAALERYERAYPFAWLGILAEAPPSREELVYMHGERGFALYSMRSPSITRLYLQCRPDEQIENWSDDRIWAELHARLHCTDGWAPTQGRVLQKSITGMRSFVTEPMQYGSLYLAGDAAHIVPPTGAKGMNLAMTDVWVLAEAFHKFYKEGARGRLENYSAICLRRVWKAQRFSWWMTSLLHRFEDACPFDQRRQLAELDYVTSSVAAATSLAENYVGLPMEIEEL
jgi:p-hydroxybenzoate 3-monooxygenase